MLVEYWQQLMDGFFNPQKRLFVGYLFTALVVAVVWLLIVKQVSLRQACAAVLAKKIWWSASSKLDYQMLLINRAIMLLISPLLLAQVTVAGVLFLALYEWLPQRPSVLLSWSDGSVSVLFTMVYFIVDDFARFYVHRLMHRWPLLWAFHKTHHSAETLTPLTVLRAHPIESIVFSLRTVVVQSLMIAVFVFFVGERVDLFSVLGASVVVVLFNAVGSNLRHSHIALFYPRWLEKILLSPAQHQVHHSVDEAHHDKNFGVAFSVWDRMFGCFIHSERHKSLVFGLSQSDVSITMNEQAKTQTLNNVYLQPFRESTKVLYKNSRQLLLISREICMKKMLSRTVGVAIVGALLSAVFFSGSAMAAKQVFVYSARKEALIKPILTRFTEETGIVVKLITGKADALLTRLRLEGKASPADVFITVDAGR
ncbi:MAG: sterol desaturase/sphingolipid hydroxylase (fatty acid hydroxylase superfamily), partial [Candidatus Endobugula sp.]